MKLNKIVTVWMIPVLAQIVVACCDCIDPVLKNYSNLSMTVDNLDNGGEKPIVTNSATVPKNAYGIKVNFHREIVACNKKTSPTFFQSAYAFSCDCPPPLEIMAKDSIVTFKVFSVYDFDSNHPAYSDISEFFKIFNYNSYSTINDYLNSKKNIGYYYGNSAWTLYDESELEFEMTLLLMTTPKINMNNKFRVQITLSDGRIFEQETTEIDFI
ncbi:MAG: DUF5034 domain-containing protein [Chryseotalea sp. WA131a]|nr:MAG: DUF5034 domain-containing protein [Chryseotalea sp. WA131a]